MAERTLELDQPQVVDDQAVALRNATERAERAEAELAKLKSAKPSAAAFLEVKPGTVPHAKTDASVTSDDLKQPPSPSTARAVAEGEVAGAQAPAEPRGSADAGGEDELRKDPMMAKLLDALSAGEDVGHYGRLVFAMVARHFLPHAQVMQYLVNDHDFDEAKAAAMLAQVEGRDYTPPKRARLMEWQSEQEFQFLDASDPDSGNLYRNLKFPDEIYKHIEHYQEAKS